VGLMGGLKRNQGRWVGGGGGVGGGRAALREGQAHGRGSVAALLIS